MTAPANLRIGDCCVDPVAGLIARDGNVERLDARTLRLLLDLAKHAGETVSIDDLLDRVWAGVIVTPDSVYQAVATLRRLLGDDPKRPRYIVTVPRLGYRMVAKVGPWTGDEPVIDLAERPPRRVPPILVALVLAAGCLTGLLAYCSGLSTVRRVTATSVGVAPFLDLTTGMDGEVLTDDLAERVADRLSQDKALATPSARSVFALKRRHLTPVQAAHTLGVAYLVDASVHGQPPAYRVTVRLTRAATGFTVWTKAYDRAPAGIATLQDAIAADVEAVLKSQPAN